MLFPMVLMPSYSAASALPIIVRGGLNSTLCLRTSMRDCKKNNGDHFIEKAYLPN